MGGNHNCTEDGPDGDMTAGQRPRDSGEAAPTITVVYKFRPGEAAAGYTVLFSL